MFPFSPCPPQGNHLLFVLRSMLAGEMTLDEVSELYVTMVYSQLGQYDLAGKKLGLDWRTVKDKVKHELINKLKR